jgi:DNA polymerase
MLKGDKRMSEWDALRAECLNCHRCGLCDTRHNVVFGEGPVDAEVMCIGEGPGEQEDLTGRPFVGRGGKLLDDMLEIIDLSRNKNIYIANMVKCRPPQNRDPLNIEQEACAQWLERQIQLIQPKIIICLGRIAAMKFIKEDFKITREHGQWFEKDGILRLALFHPAALLRDPRRKPETFDDLMTIQAKIKEVCTHTY